MAEGLARARFGPLVRVQSAGSRPSKVSSLAIQVMRELDIDISRQHTKSVDTIDPSSVETVITICAEEVCPAFLGLTHRLHWALPDPAAATGAEADRLEQFRAVRDEIARRLRTLDVATSAPGAPPAPDPR